MECSVEWADHFVWASKPTNEGLEWVDCVEKPRVLLRQSFSSVSALDEAQYPVCQLLKNSSCGLFQQYRHELTFKPLKYGTEGAEGHCHPRPNGHVAQS